MNDQEIDALFARLQEEARREALEMHADEITAAAEARDSQRGWQIAYEVAQEQNRALLRKLEALRETWTAPKPRGPLN